MQIMNKHCFSKTKDKKSATWVTYCALTKLFKQCFLLKQFHLQLSLKVVPPRKILFLKSNFLMYKYQYEKRITAFFKRSRLWQYIILKGPSIWSDIFETSCNSSLTGGWDRFGAEIPPAWNTTRRGRRSLSLKQ